VISQFTFSNPVYFGAGAIRKLPRETKALGCQRPLVVTDPGLVDCGMADRVMELLKQADIEATLFAGVDANPTEHNAEEGLACYRSEGCDGLIGFGGGSPLDAAKAIGLKVNHSLPLAQYAIGVKGWMKMTEPMPPLIAISTTSGTGSEVARGALIIEKIAGAKVAIVGPALYPSITLADPELTLDLPPQLTAGTGMDALTHCIEEYLSPTYNPIVAGTALEGVRLCAKSLERAFQDGKNLEARADMMMASMLGGMGFTKGLGVVHSLSHPVGAVIGGHHGTINAIFLPASLAFNQDAASSRYRALAQAAGLAVENQSDEACAQAFIGYIEKLNQSLAIPGDLSVYGATRDSIEEMIPMCLADHCHKTNPRECTANDFRTLLEAHIPPQ
jgi:alcohol dehydrogenase class IV